MEISFTVAMTRENTRQLLLVLQRNLHRNYWSQLSFGSSNSKWSYDKKSCEI